MLRAVLLLAFSSILAAGCAGSDSPELPEGLAIPIVTALSRTSASVGDPIEIEGTGFVDADTGWVDLVFRGSFTPDDGTPPEEVDLSIPLQTRADGTLRWERFGAYRVPFVSSGDRTGTFRGHVFARSQLFDGQTVEQPSDTWLAVTFTVLPSLVVQDFLAVSTTSGTGAGWIADCRYPAPQILNLVPYAMRVRAIGFEPLDFQYTFSEGLIVDAVAQTGTTALRHATAPGQMEHAVLTQWSPVPDNTDGYRASIVVRAQGVDGVTREVQHDFMVRRPLQIYFRGPMQIAELYEPEPVSSCIPGGLAGVGVTYSESTSETRTRQIQREVSRGWETSYGTQHMETWGTSATEGEVATRSQMVTVSDATTMGQDTTDTEMFSRTDGRTRTTNVDFSATDSESYGWRVENETVEDFTREAGGMVTAGGEAGIPLVANGSVSVTAMGRVGWVDGTRMRDARDGSMGRSETVGFGETEGLSEAETRAYSRANGYHWGLTQTYAEANGYSHATNWSQTNSFGESLTQSTTVSERLGVSESELLSVSTTESETLSVSGTVFAELYGVWYRQTARLIRFGSVVAYDLCGNGTQVGEIGLDDWTWAPNLAIGAECPPSTDLPAAQCMIPPCSGY